MDVLKHLTFSRTTILFHLESLDYLIDEKLNLWNVESLDLEGSLEVTSHEDGHEISERADVWRSVFSRSYTSLSSSAFSSGVKTSIISRTFS